MHFLKSIFLILLFLGTNSSAQDKDNPLNFTKQEQAFIKNNPIIRVSNENDWQPFDFSKNGEAKGYSVDILKNLAKKIGVEIEFVNGYTWSELLKLFDDGKIDMLHVMRKNSSRVKKYNYSEPYITWHGAYFITDDEQNIKSVKDFDNKKIGLIKGWDTTEIFKEKFPKAFLVEYKNISDSLIALSLKEVDAIISMISTAQYIMMQELITNVKLGGYVNINDFIIDNKLYFASQKDKPEIISIFNKALSLLTIEEKNALYYKWFGDKKEKKIAVGLTVKEKAYLKKKKEIKMCIDPKWMPFEKIDKGRHIGMSADYISIISSRINTPITMVPTKTWMESIEFGKARKCDIFSLVMETPSRKKYLNFTAPYLSIPLVITTTNDKFFITQIEELKDKKIGIVEGYAFAELFKLEYPNIEFIEAATIADGLEDVVRGKTFGFIDNLTTIGYQIQKNFPDSLKIAGRFDEKWELGIGVRNDTPVLLGILNKAIASIDEKTKQQITNQWVTVKYEKGFDYKLFWKVLIPFLILGLLLLISQFTLKTYNKRLKNEVAQKVEELRQKDEVLLKKHRMAEMGEMLSMIAHQWKQPLGAISSAVMSIEIKIASGKFNLNDKNDREKFLTFLERKFYNINDYVQHLSTTTDDFRNFFNPNKRKESVPLISPIESVLQIVQKPMENNGIKIIKDFKVDTKIELYQNEVFQVILNLLKNSEDNFLEKNIFDPKITVATYSHDNNYTISVCDNGGGIPEDIIEKIFDPYFSTKDEKNGAGLGLYMSKMIIEDKHLGILNVKNSKEGVCFEIILSQQTTLGT